MERGDERYNRCQILCIKDEGIFLDLRCASMSEDYSILAAETSLIALSLQAVTTLYLRVSVVDQLRSRI